MKKTFQWIKENCITIVLTIFILTVVVTFVLPLFVAIGRSMWDFAINQRPWEV